jgi:NTE family protein
VTRWSRKLKLNLALQGGGAHGAFTWGVLDRLLEEPRLEIQWISATSAGAVNAAAVASGLATSGASGARMTLKRIWDAVVRAGVPDLMRLNPFFSGLSRGANFSGMLSPYDINPLGIDPLRTILEDHIDFLRLSGSAPVELLIAATDVETGQARLFRRAGLRVEHVLASACLPTLHHAVEIDGRTYWDGGFSANPDLITLASQSPCHDTLIVELNPRVEPGKPRSATEIASRVAGITFNQPFLRDIQMIVAAKETAFGLFGGRGDSPVARLHQHRFHLIEAGRYTATLGQDSKSQPDSKLITFLFDAGRAEAERWLAHDAKSVGRHATVDLGQFVGAQAGNGAGIAGPAVKAQGSVAPFLRPPGDRSRG